jgi:hypothetical protein
VADDPFIALPLIFLKSIATKKTRHWAAWKTLAKVSSPLAYAGENLNKPSNGKVNI